MAKLHKELEKAILDLPAKEKDKMLLRLIGKNNLLAQQLQYQLLENESFLDDRRDEIKKAIQLVSIMSHSIASWMLKDIRELNSKITTHVKVTKDKYGEIELTLYLLNTFFENQFKMLEKYSTKTDTLALYIARRTDFILKKMPKLHEDYYVEFEQEINKLLQRVNTYAPAYYARQMGIPQKWEY
ncbi:hypothetical protein [Emticicia sp. TH156]|uniref:hypothetical protein n=1 Tax=Emticicia sp. TH156 TaxID=2067454 RepID=UPI000C75E82B|nr:hypothetical protein [Emticicia sp. TH156]PLK46541.1 hypothetical protein C0V77_02390 [Emticicia sp. TH156]